LRNLHSFFSSSLLGPKILSLSSPCALVNPSLVHLSWSKTSSTGILSYINRNTETPTHKQSIYEKFLCFPFILKTWTIKTMWSRMSNPNERKLTWYIHIPKRNAYKINILIFYLFQRNVPHGDGWKWRSKTRKSQPQVCFLGMQSLLQ
jgi:gamma-glutamylcysteine synthetase